MSLFVKRPFLPSILLLIMMLLGVSPVASEELTVDYLLNTRYLIPGMENPDEGEWVLFNNGKYKRNDPNDPLEARIIASAVGYLSNGKSKAGAVVYGFNTGGTGFFMYLCAVRKVNGELKPTEVVSLEDRARINSLTIKSGKIVLDWVAHRGTDPASLPTLQKRTEYKLVGNALKEIIQEQK
jgi:hypothetical protein